jgi:mannose-1-phosphate guanylyltransferase/mannose-6-phosphate isomerase
VNDCHFVDAFIEKPNTETAEEFLKDSRYLWNSGMFMSTAQSILTELEMFEPDLVKNVRMAMKQGSRSGAVVKPDKETFETVKDISIDYAMMEKTKAAIVVTARFSWNDVGSWTAVDDLGDKDKTGNVLDGSAVLHDCTNTYVYSPKRTTVGVGLTDHIIVDTDDAVLVMPKDRAQDVKSVVDQLKRENKEIAVSHAKVHRPWGTYQSINVGPGHQVKHIEVYPGEKLSLQYHHHRSEHWVVVSGIAEVTVNDDVKILTPNQSTFIPLGSVHRLYNPGAEPMHLIEVQYGDYLGEDDIVRLEDIYGRIEEEEPEEKRILNVVTA